MTTSGRLKFYLFLSGFVVSVAGQGCHFRPCLCEATYLMCQAGSFQEGFGSGLPPLTIDLNKSTKLPGGILPLNLMEIYFTNSPVIDFSNNAFDGSASTLQSLSFTNTSLTRIPDAVLHLTVLTSFSIIGAKIQDWNENATKKLALSLTSLYLGNFGSQVWPPWIKKCSNLTNLAVTDASISFIPDDAFEQLSVTLTTLTLTNNKFIVTPLALTKLNNLQILDLEGNKLTNITWLPQSKALYSIALDNNRLSDSMHVRNAVLPYQKSLRTLDLPHNLLTSIPKFDFLTKLERLDMSSNHLSDPVSGSLPSGITDVELGYNFFSSIPTALSAVKGLTNMVIPHNSITEIKAADFPLAVNDVELESNLITELTDTSFPNNSNIWTLVLNNNPLKTISISAFKNFLRLTYLSVQNTHLTRLPLALASLTSINSLDLSNNRYLVCTCMEKDLKQWINSLPDECIQGDCGHVSIYIFFKILSPNCPV